MEKINAVITGVGGYVPDYVLTNEELSRMVDTTDEWIMTRIGVKERRILNEEGLGTSYMARKAAKQLLQKTGVNPDEIDAVANTETFILWRFNRFLSVRKTGRASGAISISARYFAPRTRPFAIV